MSDEPNNNPAPLFRIDCFGVEHEHYPGEGDLPDQKFHLIVKTKAGTWRCWMTRAKAEELFKAINEQSGVDIQFPAPPRKAYYEQP